MVAIFMSSLITIYEQSKPPPKSVCQRSGSTSTYTPFTVIHFSLLFFWGGGLGSYIVLLQFGGAEHFFGLKKKKAMGGHGAQGGIMNGGNPLGDTTALFFLQVDLIE